jgi:hypothetical protein
MWQPIQRTIGDILKESINQYAIPPFQRAYKWGEEEAIDLIEDLRSYPETGEEFLFLGNFILEKPKDGKIYIIDGQQCAIKTGGASDHAAGKALAQLFKAFEKYHFINNAICDRVGNEVEKLYADYCKNYADSTDFIKTTQKLIAELKHKDKLSARLHF